MVAQRHKAELAATKDWVHNWQRILKDLRSIGNISSIKKRHQMLHIQNNHVGR
jgi:hypothetical protein